MNLTPENAYKLGKTLFPELEDPLPSVIEWFEKYESLKRGTKTPAPLSETGQRITSKLGEDKASDDGGELPLDIDTSNKIMTEFVSYVKEHKITASKLVSEIGASYPSILNWLRGKGARGESLVKIKNWLDSRKKS